MDELQRILKWKVWQLASGVLGSPECSAFDCTAEADASVSFRGHERMLALKSRSRNPMVSLHMRTLGSLIVGSLAVMCLGASASDAREGADRPKGRIAYSIGNVCLVNADGSRNHCLTHDGTDYAPIVWSFDGRRLAFDRVVRDSCSG